MSPTLVLNADYLPLGYTSLPRALQLVHGGRAEIERHRGVVRSARLALAAPKVIRMRTFIRRPHARVALSKLNIIKRDGWTCQYCGIRGGALTIDHVLPESRGGPFSFGNCVACCKRCNNRKGNRTPEEAQMPLRRQPREPHSIAFMRSENDDPDLDAFLFRGGAIVEPYPAAG